MKIMKLSLAAMLAMGTLSFGSDSLSESLSNGKFSGELKAYYFDRDKGNGATKGDILNLGLNLNYLSDSFYGVKLGLGVQTSNAPFANSEAKNAFKGDMYGSGAVLSQAYLEYALNKTTIKVGRQYIAMPLLKSSGSRLIKQSFEAATAISKDIKDTTLYAAYVNKFQNRTDGSGDIADFVDLAGDYAYVLAAVNKSIKNTAVTLAYGEADKSHDMYYMDAKYKGKASSYAYNLAAQYSETDYENATTEDASFYGFKAGVGVGGFKTYVAYAQVKDGTSKWGVTGGGSKPTIFTTAIIDAGQYDESKQYAIDANYNFNNLGFKVGARYVDIDYENSNSADFKIAYANYKFKNSLKGLKASLVYEQKDHNVDSNDFDELWLKLNYSF